MHGACGISGSVRLYLCALLGNACVGTKQAWKPHHLLQRDRRCLLPDAAVGSQDVVVTAALLTARSTSIARAQAMQLLCAGCPLLLLGTVTVTRV